MPGLIIAAPSSGSGKTTVTLGLLRALRDRGINVRGAKSGPDYIDPKFHEAACGKPCINLDAWAMSPARITELAQTDDLLIIEGAMGLFDGGPPDGRGSVADLARQLKLPVVLVVDAARMAQSVAPLVAGFARHDPEVRVAGVILNKVGSDRHAQLLRDALAQLNIPVLGVLRRDGDLSLPSRHLGLVQAQEHGALEGFLNKAASQIGAAVDLNAVTQLATALPKAGSAKTSLPFTGYNRIAVARDMAFSFIYPHLLQGWAAQGVDVAFFSPLNNEPAPKADLIYLPGGYPELHAGQLGTATTFMASLQDASHHTDIYGECGGYMVLGAWLNDADGTQHRMAGLLDLHTSFETQHRKLHLGYRRLSALDGPVQGHFTAHEFHYAHTLSQKGEPLFAVEGDPHPLGLVNGRVAGSFAHVIDHA